MVDSLSRRLNRLFRLLPLFVMLMGLGGILGMGAGAGVGVSVAYAAEPDFSSGGADPTRPPASLQSPDSALGADGAGGVGGVGGASGEAAGSGLQSIIFRDGAKPMAIINGQVVSIGGRVGDATLVSLTESSATLQGSNGKEVLHLTPTVEIKYIKQIKPVMLTPKKKVRHKVAKKKKKTTPPPESEQNPN